MRKKFVNHEKIKILKQNYTAIIANNNDRVSFNKNERSQKVAVVGGWYGAARYTHYASIFITPYDYDRFYEQNHVPPLPNSNGIRHNRILLVLIS